MANKTLVPTKLDAEILAAVRQNLGLEAEDDSRDAEILDMEPREIFQRYMTWYGIIGWEDQIIDTLETLGADFRHFERPHFKEQP